MSTQLTISSNRVPESPTAPSAPQRETASSQKKLLITAAKIALVAAVIIALIAGTILTFGAAAGLLAAGAASATAVGALYGAGAGFAASAAAAIPLAYHFKMYKYTGEDASDAAKFLMAQAATTAFAAGIGAGIGSVNAPATASLFSGKHVVGLDWVGSMEGKGFYAVHSSGGSAGTVAYANRLDIDWSGLYTIT